MSSSVETNTNRVIELNEKVTQVLTNSEPPTLKTRDTDDPAVVREQMANDYSNHMVPVTARIGKWQLTMSFWSLLSAMIWVFYGALVAGLYGTINGIIAIILSVITYSIMGAVFSTWGIRSGLNSTLLTRRMFGTVGAFLTALLITANTTYYAVFESSVLAVAFHEYTQTWDIRIWYAIVVAAMIPLMLGGVQTWMGKLNGFLLPFYGVGMIIILLMTVMRFPSVDWLSFEGIVPMDSRAYPGWILGFVLYMGVWLLLPTTQDFARFGRVEDKKFHSTVTFGPVFYVPLFLLNGVAGMYLVSTILPDEPASETGVVLAILSASGIIGLILIAISQTRINSLNFYQASTNLDRIWTGLSGIRVHRSIWVVSIGIIVFLLMLTNVFSYLERMLTWQGVFLVGWAGVALTHFVLRPVDRPFGPEFRSKRLPRFTWGLAVWFIAAGCGIIAAEVPGIPEIFSAVPALVTLVIAVVLYALGLMLIPDHRRATHADPRDEVENAAETWAECATCNYSYVVLEMDRDPDNELHPTCDACSTSLRNLSTESSTS